MEKNCMEHSKQLVINFEVKVTKKKSTHKSPNRLAVEKYEQEIEMWEQRKQEAYLREDWSAVNWASATLVTKKANLEKLKETMGRRRK